MNTRPTLHTARLTLRPFEPADAPRVKELAGDRAIADTTGRIAHPYEDGMAERWIATQQPEFEAGTSTNFAATLRESGELIGSIGLVLHSAHRRAELGYWFGKPYWGRGYATEAGQAVVRHGFADLGLARIVAHHFQRNPASGRILQKLGMKTEGVFRRHFLKWDTLEDVVCHGILREEWEEIARNNASGTKPASGPAAI